MGYRSQVALAIGKEVMPGFMAALSKNKHAIDLVFKEHDTLEKDYCGEGNLLVTWDSIKWYESYEEIMAIEAFLNDPEAFLPEGHDVDPGECFRFVRVGEEAGDVACEGHGFEIYTSTSIEFY